MLNPGARYFDDKGGESAGNGHFTETISGWMVHLTAGLRLTSHDYCQIKDVILPSTHGATSIDRIVVSQYGVFVIDTVNMKGDIFGGRDQKLWIQQTQKGKHTFQNPMYSIYSRAKILVAMLGIDARKVFPMVVFMGGCNFQTQMPENVMRSGNYVRYIKSKNIPVITKSGMSQIIEKIKASQSEPMMKSDVERPISVRVATAVKETSKICPSCGKSMSLRVAKKGDQTGKRFWVCSDFPKCWETIAAK